MDDIKIKLKDSNRFKQGKKGNHLIIQFPFNLYYSENIQGYLLDLLRFQD